MAQDIRIAMSGDSGWIDVHAHLYESDDAALDDDLRHAAERGVSRIVNTAVDLATCRRIVEQCGMFDRLYGAAGIAPSCAAELPDDWSDQLLRHVGSSDAIIAIGEIGLDAVQRSYPSLTIQTPVFERQLVIARERGLPAVIHSRGAERDVVHRCRALGIEKALFHCFTGNKQALRDLLDAGYSVSFSGIVTFDAGVRALAEYAPLDRLCIETDTPYLTPVPFRGKRPNRPGNVAYIGEAIAALKGMTNEELRERLAMNFETVFAVTRRTTEHGR
jgi:TatD DNase family protein